ncbi:MAG: hypothetical protein Fur0032_14150 [Terrimicrobiaceae bacterium]
MELIERLEDRIAPAAVVLSQGGNLLNAGDEGYLSLGSEPSSSALLVKVTSGKALVFWDATQKLIKGISVTDNIRMEVRGDVDGDIVTNLLTSGFLSDSDNNPANGQDGGRLLASSIRGIQVTTFVDQSGNTQSGNIGRIVAGGSVSNVSVSGALGGVFAGDGIFDAVQTATSPVLTNGLPTTTYIYDIGFDFDSSGPINATSMSLTQANASFGTRPSISQVAFTSGTNVQIFAGDGTESSGARLDGGGVTGLKFVTASADPAVVGTFFAGKSVTVVAGDGSVGSARGGHGGALTDIRDLGSTDDVFLKSGDGGAGVTNGGNGGLITLLDLLGAPESYFVQAGDGGDGNRGGNGGSLTNNNVASLGSSQFITIAANFHSAIGAAIDDADQQGFFVINRGTGEMTLIAGDTLATIPPLITALAAAPVDAALGDFNSDNFLDVVVAYSDGRFGILINDQADGFTYSVGNLGGFVPSQVVVGDFLGVGGRPELVFVSTTGASTALTMWEITDPVALDGADPASAFTSDPTRIKPFTISRGNLVEAVGGSFPISALGALKLNRDAKDDLILGFSDGVLQGVVSQGSATSEDPFTFAIDRDTPSARLSGGLRDVEFNFAKNPAHQRLAMITADGGKAQIATITAATESDKASISISNTALKMPRGTDVGTLLQVSWTSAYLDQPVEVEGVPVADFTRLAVLASTGNASTVLSYDTSFTLRGVATQDFAINGMANNFLMTSVAKPGEADSYLFTVPSPTLAFAHQQPLPLNGVLPLEEVTLPFVAKSAALLAGNGGSGNLLAGGNGGFISGLNIDSGSTLVQAGDGGFSTAGAGGHGGSIDNAKSFKTSAGLEISPAYSASTDLTVEAGRGSSVLGIGTAARGGNGGAVESLLVLQSPDLEILAGNGGSSQGAAAGTGGRLFAITVANAGDVDMASGSGGSGTTTTKASAANGGEVRKITLGSPNDTAANSITGDVAILSGSGGSSSTARAANGGHILDIVASNFLKALGTFSVTAGSGGASMGISTSSTGGGGGTITNIQMTDIRGFATLAGGEGGSSMAGNAGKGGFVKKTIASSVGLLSAIGGDGGHAMAGKGAGGSGGEVVDVIASLTSSGYATFSGGDGGDSVGGRGAAGAQAAKINLTLNPSDTAGADETLGVSILGGNGGNGTSGGHGGAISKILAEGVYDQASGSSTVINSIALRLAGGDGGMASTGAGGNGGSVRLDSILRGISHIDADSINPDFLPGDEALRVRGGDGGNGVTKGGTGGSVAGIKVANSLNTAGNPIPVNLLASAWLSAGDGGNTTNGSAGAGGSVSNSSLGAESYGGLPTGNVLVQSGDGGTSLNGAGGVGGNISQSTFISITGSNTDGYGVFVVAGNGGDGGQRGGGGGSLTAIKTTLPSVGVTNTLPTIFAGVFLAGDGGDGTGASGSTGGNGGHVRDLKQDQNVFSVVNVIMAGSGGDSSADKNGGRGGDVSSAVTVSSFGAQDARVNIGDPPIPQGQFNTVATSALIQSYLTTPNSPQGIYAGLGGGGLAEGANGSVRQVKGQNIAALGAADRSGTFENATSVAGVTALLVAFDINGSGTYQPGDGFVMADSFSGLKSLNPSLVSNAALQARTAAFVI